MERYDHKKIESKWPSFASSVAKAMDDKKATEGRVE